MALNVEQITSRLAQMPDAALQKYAAMNKNDPYIMALAVSESNRRKQLRQSAQAQQGQMQQPKVVDAAVQSMAQPMPEDMGIARLPAGDMNFADGGIVAFADGGEVERYQTGGTILPALMAQYEREAQEMGEGRRTQFSPELKPVVEQLQAPRRAAEQSFMQREQAQMLQGPALLNRSNLPSLTAQPSAAPVATPTAASSGSPSPIDPNFRRQTDPRMLGVSAVSADTPLQYGRTTLRPESAQRDLGTPAQARVSKPPAAAPASTATQDAGLAALDPNKMFEEALRKQRGEERPEKDMLKELNKERTAAAEKELEGERALEKRFADAYKGRRERLAAREGELGKMKDQNLGLALLQAGAAMMSTVGNVGTAVGKGIQAGSQQYVAGLDKLNAAKDKLADARDRLDDLQLNRDEMSARAIQKAENKIRDTAIAGQESMIKYIMERDNVDRTTAAKIVDTQIQLGLAQFKEEGLDRRSANEIASRERISAQDNATRAKIAGMLPAEMRAAMMLGKGTTDQERYLSGAKLIQEAAADKSGLAIAKLLATINADERKNGEPLTTAADLLNSLTAINTQLYPKVGNNAPTRARPAQ